MCHGVVNGITRCGMLCGLIGALLFAPGCGSSGGEMQPTEPSVPAAAGPMSAFGDLLPNAEELWAANVPNEGGSLESIHLLGDMLLLRGSNQHLTALDRNGVPQWVFKRMDLAPEFPPAVGPTAIALVTRDMMWVIDKATGDLVSRHSLSFTPSAPPALSASTAYVPSLSDNRIYAIGLADGKQGWRARLDGPITAAPTVAGTVGRPVLVVATEGGGIYAYPAVAAGATAPDPTWTRRLPGNVLADVHTSVDGSTVFVSSEDYTLYALNAGTGEASWKYHAGMPLKTSASHVTGPGAGAGMVFQQRAGALVGLDAASGDKKWEAEAGTHGVCSWGDDFIVAGPGNSVRRLRAKDGDAMGSGSVSEAYLVPDPSKGHFIVADRDWKLRVYRHRKW